MVNRRAFFWPPYLGHIRAGLGGKKTDEEAKPKHDPPYQGHIPPSN